MRGSKPGRSPVAALTCVASVSVIVASPLGVVPTASTGPSGSGRFVSSGSSSGSLRKRSESARTPPSIVIGPRIALTRSSSAGKTSASPPSTKSSSTARTKTVWRSSQSCSVKTTCGVTSAPPALSGEIRIEATTVVPSSRPIVMTRPATATS